MLLIKDVVVKQLRIGFVSEGRDVAIIVNFPSELYNYEEPNEFRAHYNNPIPYGWEVKYS